MDLANYPANFSKITKHPINPYPTHNAEIHASCFQNTGGQPATNYIGIKALMTQGNTLKYLLGILNSMVFMNYILRKSKNNISSARASPDGI